MNKEQMLLDALNRFGNFTRVTQEFSDEQLGVIYELMEMVDQRHKVSGVDARTEPALPIQNVRRSFTRYAIFEIADKGSVKMVYTAEKNEERDHSFKTKEEAHEWLINNADNFRRYFIVKQVTVY